MIAFPADIKSAEARCEYRYRSYSYIHALHEAVISKRRIVDHYALVLPASNHPSFRNTLSFLRFISCRYCQYSRYGFPSFSDQLGPFVHDFVFLLSSGVTVFNADKDGEHGLEAGSSGRGLG